MCLGRFTLIWLHRLYSILDFGIFALHYVMCSFRCNVTATSSSGIYVVSVMNVFIKYLFAYL